MKDWQKLRPPEDALQFYGNYPDPNFAEEYTALAAVNM